MASLLSQAREFAAQYHAGQVRKYTGNPYIEHCLAVLSLVKQVPNHTEAMACAAVLHDVIEDTDASAEEILRCFGREVHDLVVALTDTPPEYGNRAKRKKLDRERLAKAPKEAKTVKLADLIDNCESILKYDRDFAKVYLREKRLLLDEALMDGNQVLWEYADVLVRQGLKAVAPGLAG